MSDYTLQDALITVAIRKLYIDGWLRVRGWSHRTRDDKWRHSRYEFEPKSIEEATELQLAREAAL